MVCIYFRFVSPKELQKCFESRDIPMLQVEMSKLPEDEARYHLKRCVDSGLWVPEADAAKKDGATEERIAETAAGEPEKEEIYHEAKSTIQSTTEDVD